jgi:hypothetical protein
LLVKTCRQAHSVARVLLKRSSLPFCRGQWGLMNFCLAPMAATAAAKSLLWR